MSNQFQNDSDYYQDYKKRLSAMIFEKAKGKIPQDMCNDLARIGTEHKKYDDFQDKERSIEERVDYLISAYFA